MMRILFLGNNRLASWVAGWLRSQGEEIGGLVLHPRTKRRFGDRLIESSGVPPERIFDGSRLKEPQVLEAIRRLEPTLGLSVLFGYILRPEFLDIFPRGVVNLHPALLPYNRGAYPNVWSIVDATPAGTTLHFVDEDVDTGDIVAQREVRVEPVDTGQSLYAKLERASFELFKEVWPRLRAGHVSLQRQERHTGTYHRLGDVDLIDEISPQRMYKASELIDRIRARTFPPFPGSYFVAEGRKVYLRLQLLYEEEIEREMEQWAGRSE